jgi:hypothetical protein
MPGRLDAIVGTTIHGVDMVADRTAAVDPRAVLVGVALSVMARAVRTRAWLTILRATFPEATGLRAGDVMRAYLAGSGLNAILPARGGDVVKLAMVHRRIEGSRYATLAATFVPETLFETAFGVALTVWALVEGFLPLPTASRELPAVDVSVVLGHPAVSALGAGAAGALGWWLVRRLGAPLRQGTAILRSPMRFVTGVASWQGLARLIRLGSLAAFMAAFGLPVTPATVLLVMTVQGAARILPFAPASAGLRLAMLSYGFAAVTGQPVDIAVITAFTLGVGAILIVTAVAIAVALLALECDTRSPRRALAAARTWGPRRARPAYARRRHMPDHDEPAVAGTGRRSHTARS